MGPPKRPHRFRAAALPLVSDPDIEVCGAVAVVDGERGLIVRDGVISEAVLEQEIPNVHDGRNAARVGIERRAQGGNGRDAIAALQVRQRALVVDERS